tara:strand:+ start:1996 stop:2211 length:216 start_codon:yes stop_codon:yes gene_type:complete
MDENTSHQVKIKGKRELRVGQKHAANTNLAWQTELLCGRWDFLSTTVEFRSIKILHHRANAQHGGSHKQKA